MTTCIKCGQPCEHSICSSCADVLLDSFSPEDQLAYAMLGQDVLRDRRDGITRPQGYLAERLKIHKGVDRK